MHDEQQWYCRECRTVLSPPEAARYVKQEQDLEAFERSLRAGRPALDADDSTEILESLPAAVAPAAPGLTFKDGQVLVPAHWGLPLCDRCEFVDVVTEVLHWPNIDMVERLVFLYETGLLVCVPASVVRAYSWSLVARDWYREAVKDDPTDAVVHAGCQEWEAKCLALQPQLTPDEQRGAVQLAQHVSEIWAQLGVA
jgi:hypothetical protein